MKDVGTVPKDREYCEVLNKANKGTEADLFDCFKNEAKLPMKKELCDRLYPYDDPDYIPDN